jgi:hypothetical protein
VLCRRGRQPAPAAGLGESVSGTVATASAHRAAWFISTWLLALSIVAGVAAAELLARSLDTDMARVGRSLYLVGSGLGLASTSYDLAVTSKLLGTSPLPAWYLGAEHWAEGLATAYFALLAPAALACFGWSIWRTGRLPRWPGAVLLIAAAALLGQFAVFRGALPFPQFLAFIALGAAALARPYAPAPQEGAAPEHPAGEAGLVRDRPPSAVPDPPRPGSLRG